MGDGASTRTFLFTDVEGSTRLWEDEPEAMRRALDRHDQIVRATIESGGGSVFFSAGDGFAAEFAEAAAAVQAAVAVQVTMLDESWPVSRPLRVRMGLHTGTAHGRDDNWFGPPVNRCARLMSVAHGGQIVCSDTTASLARDALPPEITLVDLDEHRLRDLARPVRVYQIQHDSLPADFPPLRSLEAYPTNLPAQTTAFIGRDDDLREIAKVLRESRIVTLTGVGGVGKTRLAVQVAADMLPSYRDGAWFVELAGVSDVDSMEEALAAALGAQPQSAQSLRDSLLALLRRKQLLIVLDNCEHLLEPIAVLIDAALATSPGVAVLATSREALGIPGERVIGVRSLGLPRDSEARDDVAAADAVRLFVERAQSARAGFALTADNASVVAQLCRRLDGIPLAIELAAARVRSMAPAEIAARLDQRFRLLTGGSRTAANRHQTLRRAIDWSWDLLDDAEATLMQRLASCVGGFDLAAAEAIGQGDGIDALDIDDLLGHLVDKSLVAVDDVGEATRYRMLETVREYALERLGDAGEIDAARESHAEHYATFAEEAGRGLRTADERVWLDLVELELDNLRLAVTWSSEAGRVDLALRIVTAFAMPGLPFETSVAAWAELATSATGAEDDPRYAVGLAAQAWGLLRAGAPDAALELAERALALCPASTIDDAWRRCRVLAVYTGANGMLAKSTRVESEEWLELSRRVGDPFEEAQALCMVAVADLYEHGAGAALWASEQAYEVARRAGSPSVIAHACLMLGLTGTDPKRAFEIADEAFEAASSVRNDFTAWIANNNRGLLLAQQGDHRAAARVFLESATRNTWIGHRANQALAQWGIACLLAANGRDEQAAVMYGWIQPTAGHLIGYPLLPDAIVDALYTLSDRFTPQRYAELLQQGASMEDDEALLYAQRAVEEFVRGT